MHVDLSDSKSSHSFKNKIARVLWGVVWWSLYRPTPNTFHGWRCLLLRLFGARIGKGVRPYQSAKIWAPWNLEMADFSCMGHYVDCYSVDKIYIGQHATVSQYSYLCTGSHDISDPKMALITAPIIVERDAWVAADVYIGPGVKVGEGAVVGARSSVYKDVAPWIVVGGNPAKEIKKRTLRA